MIIGCCRGNWNLWWTSFSLVGLLFFPWPKLGLFSLSLRPRLNNWPPFGLGKKKSNLGKRSSSLVSFLYRPINVLETEYLFSRAVSSNFTFKFLLSTFLFRKILSKLLKDVKCCQHTAVDEFMNNLQRYEIRKKWLVWFFLTFTLLLITPRKEKITTIADDENHISCGRNQIFVTHQQDVNSPFSHGAPSWVTSTFSI